MKDWIDAFYIIDYISVGILLTAMTMNALNRLESCVRSYTINSWLLSLLVAVVAVMIGEGHLYFAAVVTLATKGILIPVILKKIVRQMKDTHEVEPYISNSLSLSISGILVAVVYASLREGIFVSGFSRNVLQISIAVILIGLGFYKRELSIEAAWKYIILCTVGITFALLGTFITYYASTSVMGTPGVLEWTALRGIAGKLNPSTMKLAFVFILVGYGTKAGLAPVHNWLPDAHSQAPSPISALLSGILLNTAFYGIMRFVSIVEPSTGAAFSHNLLILFGVISMGIASVFIMVQDNYKRLLAYSSIEHMGIISLGVGIGGPVGIYGALLHILNHALSKPLMFFASGKIQSRYGTTRIEDVSGVLSSNPVLGAFTFIGALSLAGAPPFNIFISEFTILKAAVDGGLWGVAGLFLFFAVIVFYGILKGFGKMLFNNRRSLTGDDAMGVSSQGHSGYSIPEISALIIMGVMAALVIMFGFTIPACIDSTIKICAGILGAI